MKTALKAIAELASLIRMTIEAWKEVNKEISIEKDRRHRLERNYDVIGRMRKQNKQAIANVNGGTVDQYQRNLASNEPVLK